MIWGPHNEEKTIQYMQHLYYLQFMDDQEINNKQIIKLAIMPVYIIK
jgi:hypothetical protein